MKQLLKTILPKDALCTARDIHDRIQIAVVSRKDFDAHSLQQESDLTIEHHFTDPAIAKDWQDDHKTICSIFENNDKWGGINPGDRRALYTLIRGLKPKSVLEVGTHIGASTLYIARALKANNNDARITTVDILDVNDPQSGPWKKNGLPMPPQDMATHIDCSDLIKFVAQPSLDYMRSSSEKFDFIFLDGDHSPRTVYNEVAAALDNLAPNGVILLHDYYPDAQQLFPDDTIIYGPFRALKRIQHENSDIMARPLGALPWPTKQGSHATSLAFILKNPVR